MTTNLSIGKAGELRVASELLIRGFEVHLSLVDYGSDLLLSDGTRIQVKAAHNLSHNYWKYKAYTFSFKKWKNKNGHFKPHALKDIDFIILWGIDDDLFFIIPAKVIRGKYSVRVSTSSKRNQYSIYKDKWEILKRKER